tara:strand:- start:2188 stop:2946 length:759 start_codon:yes stop_codon:yes gene_type:complete
MAFLDQYFIKPFNSTIEYNIVNTLVYAILAFMGIVLIYKLLDRQKVEINAKLAISLIPYILLGALIRAYVDHNLIPKNLLTASPGIYLSIAAVFVAGLLLRRVILVGIAGLIITLILFGIPSIMNAWYLLAITLVTLATIGISIFIAKKLNQKWFNQKLTLLAYSGQLFDALNTSFILQLFGGFEKHVIPRAVIRSVGTPFAFIPLKLIVVIPILYLLSKSKEDKFARLILVSAFVLGFAQGIRNLTNILIF